MTEKEIDFLEGIIFQLQNFVDEHKEPYYLIVSFENKMCRSKVDYNSWVHKEFAYYVSKENGSSKPLFFKSIRDAEKYGDRIIGGNLIKYRVANRNEERPEDHHFYVEGDNY